MTDTEIDHRRVQLQAMADIEQLHAVRRRLLASQHARQIDSSVEAHGWERADLEEGLAIAGSWQALEDHYAAYQRGKTIRRAQRTPEDDLQHGRDFLAYVRFPRVP